MHIYYVSLCNELNNTEAKLTSRVPPQYFVFNMVNQWARKVVWWMVRAAETV